MACERSFCFDVLPERGAEQANWIRVLASTLTLLPRPSAIFFFGMANLHRSRFRSGMG